MNEITTLPLSDHTVAFVDELAAGDDAGLPLLLLHGGAADHRMWGPQVKAFPERRVVSPDARGHGGTSDAEHPYRLADDVVALMDALKIERAAIAGVSMGGGTAVDVALEHPDRCAGLVVTGTGTSEPTFTDPWALRLFANWQRAAAAGDAEGWVETFLQFTPVPHRRVDEVEPGVLDLLRRMAVDTVAEHVRLDDDGVPVPPTPPIPVPRTWERVPDLGVPVLALNGSLDGDDHLENGRRLARLAPRGQQAEIADAAHYPNLEHPEPYNNSVRAFLAEHGL